MHRNQLPRLHELAAAQRGLVSRRQCLELGAVEADVDGLVRRGALVAFRWGVYAVPGLPPDIARPVMAAVLAAGTGAVASHQTAAGLLGLGRVACLRPVHLLVRDTTRDELPGVISHRTVRLDACDRTDVDGIPCTSGARTLIDLAAVLDRATLTALVDDAIGLGVVSRRWLHRRATALRPGRAGVGILISLTEDGAEGEFRSWLERRASYVLRAGGVPAPAWNEPIRSGGRLLGIADACWAEARLIAEFDGLRFHNTGDQRRADAERERELVLAGWRVLRFSWMDIDGRPDDVASAIRRALTRTLSDSQ